MPANPAPPNAVVPSVLLGLSLIVSAGLAARAPRTFDALGPCVPGLFAPLQATREAVPLALAHHRGAIYALLATPDREGFSVEVFRLRGSLSTRIATRRAPSLDAISGFVVGSNGPMFAVARRETVTVTTLGDTVRDAEFPRGEQPEGRPALTPTLALAAEPDGTPTALLGWPGLYATRRLHARDVRESPSYTPPRRDTFGAHDLTLLHDRAVLVQEHREGSFTAPPQDRVSIELASVPVSPFHIERPRTLRLTDAPDGHTPHVAALPSTDPPEVLVSYATARSVELVRVTPIPSPVGWRVLNRQHAPATPPDALASDLGTAAGACDAVLAWRTSTALLLRAIDSRSGRVGAITRLPAPAGTHAPRVTLVRSGALTLVATHGARGVSVYSAFQDPDCSLDLRPVALPNTPAFGPGARLAGFAGDDARAVLAVTHATLDDARTPLTFATIAPTTGLASAVPPPETIPSSVRDLGIFNAPTAVVAGFSARGLRLQRVGDVRTTAKLAKTS